MKPEEQSTKLKGLTMKFPGQLAGMQLSFTNGQESPMFETRELVYGGDVSKVKG